LQQVLKGLKNMARTRKSAQSWKRTVWHQNKYKTLSIPMPLLY
jgi:hypothetical protein